MAEAIVKFVLGKVGEAAVKEALRLYGVDEQVEMVGRELERIQAFLKDADKKQIKDERQKHWVREVREVAYSIEDAIDTFLAEIPEKQSSGVMAAVKRMINGIIKLPAVHELTDEISQIQSRLKEIEDGRRRYGIDNLGDGSGVIELPIKPILIPDVDPDVVGFEADLEHIVKELLDDTNKRRSVVSIWGTGGLGKTTLAQKAYNTNGVKDRFDLHIWLTISQKFELLGILRKIGKELKFPVEQLKEEGDFIKIHEFLKGKRYLIVLDDVWTKELWTKIGGIFPEDNNGSRVLLTTRLQDVAKEADLMRVPHQLGFLTDELSLQLLLKSALPNKSASDDLLKIANQFVNKCGGLPLALVVLGGLLAKKPDNYIAWNKMLETMSWHIDGKMCNGILDISFENLSFALKSCFMYFSAFPEDYIIEAESLIRMWVAEGFIPQEDNRTLEQIAESFIEDLVQRSMVQVALRNADGSIECFDIHDLMLDLAIQKAKEDNFMVVYSCPYDQSKLSKARRVAIHVQSDCDELIMSPKLRTMLCFGVERMPNCSRHRLLKVVSNDRKGYVSKVHQEDMEKFEGLIQLEDLEKFEGLIQLEDMGKFEGLIQLRYLHLDKLVRGKCEKNYLPKVIGSMRNLQTLHICSIRGSDGECLNLPDCIWNINTLRHVHTFSGTVLSSSTKLTNLQSLVVGSEESWEKELPHLPNLRSLDLEHKSPSWEPIVAFLKTLKRLTNLGLRAAFPTYLPLEILNMKGFSFYHCLQFLTLDGIPSDISYSVDMFPPYLVFLEISNYQPQQDIMSILEKLPCLKELWITIAPNIKKMRCSAGGFAQLKRISFWYLLDSLEEWEIEEGAVPILDHLNMDKLNIVPHGLQYLSNLRKLAVNKKHKAEVLNLCKYVPEIYFR